VEFKDYYGIMGVDPAASVEDIRIAYKKLARKYHPDVSQEKDAQQRFQEIGEAYDVLKDPEKRREFDELRAYIDQGEPQGGWQYDQQGATGQFDFDELINSIFSSQKSGRGFEDTWAYQPETIERYEISVTLEESYSGCRRLLSITGQGGGIKKVNVVVPAGIVSGNKLRLAGQGNGGNDLYLQIHVEEHEFFRVEGKDIHLEVPVAPWEAALGSEIEVPTLGGKVNLRLRENTTSEQKLRLKGRGLPAYAGASVGDQFVTLKVVNPMISSDQEKEAYQKLAENFKFNPRVKLARVMAG